MSSDAGLHALHEIQHKGRTSYFCIGGSVIPKDDSVERTLHTHIILLTSVPYSLHLPALPPRGLTSIATKGIGCFPHHSPHTKLGIQISHPDMQTWMQTGKTPVQVLGANMHFRCHIYLMPFPPPDHQSLARIDGEHRRRMIPWIARNASGCRLEHEHR